MRKLRAKLTCSIFLATLAIAVTIPASALGNVRTVGSCSAPSPQTYCMAQGFMRNKPRAIVIQGSASPAQAFRIPFRVFCQGGGGEIKFAKQGQIAGSETASTVIHIPRTRRTRHCTAQAAISAQGPSSGSSFQLTIRERF